MKILGVIIVIGLIFTTPVLAAEHRSGDVVVVDAGEIVEKNLLARAMDVRIYGHVQGDLFALCRNLRIEGTIDRDIQSACQTLELKGNVGDGILFIGESLIIDGEVAGDVMALGKTVRIGPNGDVAGDVYIGAGELKMDGGIIRGALKTGAGSVRLNGMIGKTAEVYTKEIHFGPEYRAQGGTYLKAEKLLDENKIGNAPENLYMDVEKERHWGISIWSMVAAIIVGLILVMFFGTMTRGYLDLAKSNPLKNGLWGLLYIAVVLIALVVLFLLIFTIPLALILTGLFLIALYLSTILASLSFGEWLMHRFGKDRTARSLILFLVIGVLLVKLLTLLPFYIGGLIEFIVVCYGFGSLVNYILRQKRIWEAGAEA